MEDLVDLCYKLADPSISNANPTVLFKAYISQHYGTISLSTTVHYGLELTMVTVGLFGNGVSPSIEQWALRNDVSPVGVKTPSAITLLRCFGDVSSSVSQRCLPSVSQRCLSFGASAMFLPRCLSDVSPPVPQRCLSFDVSVMSLLQ